MPLLKTIISEHTEKTMPQKKTVKDTVQEQPTTESVNPAETQEAQDARFPPVEVGEDEALANFCRWLEEVGRIHSIRVANHFGARRATEWIPFVAIPLAIDVADIRAIRFYAEKRVIDIGSTVPILDEHGVAVNGVSISLPSEPLWAWALKILNTQLNGKIKDATKWLQNLDYLSMSSSR